MNQNEIEELIEYVIKEAFGFKGMILGDSDPWSVERTIREWFDKRKTNESK